MGDTCHVPQAFFTHLEIDMSIQQTTGVYKLDEVEFEFLTVQVVLRGGFFPSTNLHMSTNNGKLGQPPLTRCGAPSGDLGESLAGTKQRQI